MEEHQDSFNLLHANGEKKCQEIVVLTTKC